MASTGPNNPATAANDAAVGTEAWFSGELTDCFTSDNVYSRLDSNLAAVEISNYLKVTNFSFSIPAGSTIDGIVVEIERQKTGSGVAVDNIVKLIKGGTIQGDNKASGSSYPSSDAYATYGGATDMWGLSLSEADVESSGLGVALSVKNTHASFAVSPKIDHFRITVYYTEPVQIALAGAQGAPSGAISKMVAEIDLSGTQDDPAGALSVIPAFTLEGAQDPPSGELSLIQTLLRTLTGSQDAPAGALSLHAFIALLGAQGAPAGVLSLIKYLTALTGAQLPGSGSLSLIASIGISGVQGAPSGNLSVARIVGLTGAQGAPSGAITYFIIARAGWVPQAFALVEGIPSQGFGHVNIVPVQGSGKLSQPPFQGTAKRSDP